MKKTVALFAMIIAASLAGCTKKSGPGSLPPAPADTIGSEEGTGSSAPAAALPGSQADFLASIAADRIYFDTDKFDVDADDKAVLQSQAQWLLRYPHKRVVIEGHCDERGTRDYNLALGERRANAAKNYLASLGIDPARMSTISYGKERPAAVGSDEAAWAQNRRAVTMTVE